MTKAVDVFEYVATKHSFTGEMQAHKLLYYMQGWSLAWDGEALFDDDVEAWPMGPVIREVRWRWHNSNGVLPRHAARDDGLSSDVKRKIDAVLAFYGANGGRALSELTHSEAPWCEARDGLGVNEPSNRRISRDLMRREYTKQSMRGEGPRPPVRELHTASEEEVLRIAEEVERDWPRTLELLAR